MKIHEYQAKSVLARYGVPVPRGEVATTPDEAGDIARRLGGNLCVVKAQIHAGGRGKGGGVKVAKSVGEAEELKDLPMSKRSVPVAPDPTTALVISGATMLTIASKVTFGLDPA